MQGYLKQAFMFQDLFNGVLGAQFGVCLHFQPKLWTFATLGLHPLHSPSFVIMCFTPKHTLGLMGPFTSHLIVNPMLGLQHPWCSSQHFCFHCAKCKLSCGTRTTTCASLNHVQFLPLMSQHYVRHKWHSHPSWCYHCWPNVYGFTFLLLQNSRICCLWCSSIQKKELLQSTPHQSIPPFGNWGIWMSAQTS